MDEARGGDDVLHDQVLIDDQVLHDDKVLHIDCDECVAQHTDACEDCIVTFLCGREPDDAVIIDVAEVRALKLLGQGGLVPTLRHRPRTGTG